MEIELITGRHHQIRVQFAYLGFPILGDMLYGNLKNFIPKQIALHAASLEVIHPVLKEKIIFNADIYNWPEKFASLI